MISRLRAQMPLEAELAKDVATTHAFRRRAVVFMRLSPSGS
ncbi:MAG: hypothetical protein WDN69_11075 [Aliidongia sp.]